jgi:thiamine-phosphate pyrophosphorylase
MPERAFPSGVYAITPECTDTDLLLKMVESALKGGVAAVQYRDKTADVALRHEQASELLELCRDHAVPLIINDDLRLADLVGADGVHLGREDGNLREARLILGPEKLVGISCYQNPDLAFTAQAGGADYVAFGSFHPSTTKPQASRASIELLHHAAASVWVPIVAIGGINVDNAGPLIDAGADCIAVISALFDAPDIEMAARALNDLFVAETEN